MDEARLVAMLRANQTSAIEALGRGDNAALMALAIHEAMIMDDLRAIWRSRCSNSS